MEQKGQCRRGYAQPRDDDIKIKIKAGKPSKT
jgi:hypothetical protein